MGRLFQQLLERFAGIATAFRPIDDVVFDLADATRQALGAKRVAIYLVLLPAGGRVEPELSAYCGDTGAPDRRRRVLRDLEHSADGVVVGDLRLHTLREEQGRVHVRLRTPFALAWLWTEGVASSRETNDDLSSALGVLANSYRNEVASSTRRAFYDGLLALETYKYESAQQEICHLWRKALGAKWVWLWTHNQSARLYELSAESADQNLAPNLDEPRTPAAKEHGIGHYADEVRRPVYAANLATWAAEHEDQQYRMLLAPAVARLGARSAIYVPLLSKDAKGADGEDGGRTNGGSTNGGRRSDVVALYFDSEEPPKFQPDEALLHMGRWTRQVLIAEEAAKQRRIRAALMSLTQRYLTQSGSRPKEIRDSYLAEILELFKSTIRAKGVSIFLRTRFTDSIQCIASTGLTDADGVEIAPSQYPTVYYEPGEGLTGKCYQQNRTIISPTPETEGHGPGKYDEIRHGSYPDGEPQIDPLLMQPMPAHPTDRSQGAIGVVRATEHHSPTLPGRMSHFREEDANTLSFLARQVSPVLQTLNVRIQREESIAIIRHDLLTPLQMIRDTVELLRDELEEGRPVRDRELRNVEIETYRSLRLAQDLGDNEQMSKEQLRPRPTLLEGDIVARLKSMLTHMAEKRSMRIWFDDRFRSIPRLMVDPVLIERALVNVVVNAIKYGHEGTTVRIESSTARPNYFGVSVSNTGIGVREEDKQRIFQPNFRADEAMQVSGPSVGLGLAISRRIMQLHGGDLELTALDGPTVFTLLIPTSARVL